jgi:hypothetical protein
MVSVMVLRVTRLSPEGNHWDDAINISDKGHGGLACDVASALRLIYASAPLPRSIKPLALTSAEEGLACLILMLGERGGEGDATKIPIADISQCLI